MGWFRQKRWPIYIIKSTANQKVAGLSKSMFGLGKTRSRPAETNDVLRRLTGLEDLLDFVDILGHRAFT